MSEEYQNQETKEQKNECECNENCNCGCEDYDEITAYYDRTESLLKVSALANITTAIFVVIMTGLMVLNYTSNKLQYNGENAKAQKHQQQGPIFKNDSMTLEDAIAEGKPTVVLFYADWCPHCQNFAPTFKNLSKDRKLNKKYNFVRINSESPDARVKMEEFGVEGFPALFLFEPNTKEKHFIPNNLLFGDFAKDTLKDIIFEHEFKK